MERLAKMDQINARITMLAMYAVQPQHMSCVHYDSISIFNAHEIINFGKMKKVLACQHSPLLGNIKLMKGVGKQQIHCIVFKVLQILQE
jgi:hypothetical protein